jgi:hypothetical protein
LRVLSGVVRFVILVDATSPAESRDDAL